MPSGGCTNISLTLEMIMNGSEGGLCEEWRECNEGSVNKLKDKIGKYENKR